MSDNQQTHEPPTELVRRLAVAGTPVPITAGPCPADYIDRQPLVIFRDNDGACEVLSLEGYVPTAPRFVHGGMTTEDVDSFIAYVKEHTRPETRVFLDSTGASARAIFDFHAAGAEQGPAKPGNCLHTATLALEPSEAWKTWTEICGKNVEQEELAEFLEENQLDVVEPAGAKIYEIALTLQASATGTFEKAIRLENGDVRFNYVNTTTATAGPDGKLTIPPRITLKVPAYRGLAPVDVECAFRYRLRQGRLYFQIRMLRRERLLQTIRDDVREQINAETGVQTFIGQFSSP